MCVRFDRLPHFLQSPMSAIRRSPRALKWSRNLPRNGPADEHHHRPQHARRAHQAPARRAVAGPEPLDLGGWRLTNDAGDLNQWTFPPGTVLTNDTYLIVYASSANAPDANGNLHTNFIFFVDHINV